MALTVNTDTASLNIQKNLNKASDALSTSMSRQSSEVKINTKKDPDQPAVEGQNDGQLSSVTPHTEDH